MTEPSAKSGSISAGPLKASLTALAFSNASAAVKHASISDDDKAGYSIPSTSSNPKP